MIHNTLIFRLLMVACGLLMLSCGEQTSEEFEANKFTRIYDNNQFASSFTPLDIRQTSDKGFLIMGIRTLHGESLSTGIYLMKVDQFGNFEKDFILPETYIRGLAGLTLIGDTYHFFCMDDQSLTHLVETDVSFDQVNITPVGLTYPAASSYNGNDEFLLLSYDHVDKKSVVSRIRLNGSITLSRKFKIADDDSLEDLIIKHFLGTGTQFPFSVGKLPNGQYFFNGFFDYTFSLVFTRLTDDDDVDQFIHGQHEDGGLSAIFPLGSNQFAAAYFNFGSNYFLPKVSMADNPGSISKLGGYHVRELVPDANVKIIQVTVTNKTLLLYGTDTRSKQIGLYLYDENTQELSGSKYLGFSNPYEIGNMIQTEDDGLAVVGTAFIAGRFPRICLFKISKEDLEKSVR